MRPYILLVEDHPIDIELAQVAIERCNLPHDTIVVRDGQEALDFLQKKGQYAGRTNGNPDVILLDLKLPKVDGLEVLADIRARLSLADVPVIILSSSNQETDVRRAKELNATEYLVKPIDWASFVKIMCQTLKIHMKT